MSSTLESHVRLIAGSKSPDLTSLRESGTDVYRLLIGDCPDADDTTFTPVERLPVFDADYPDLRELILWQVTQLTRIPKLPPGCRRIEIRNCPDLAEIEPPPHNLYSVVIENCPQLSDLKIGGRKHITELSLRGCTGLPAETLVGLLSGMERLEILRLDACTQLNELATNLPGSLKRLELNDCTALCFLHDPLPPNLVRLGLKSCRNLKRLPALPRHLDYVDLGGTESLKMLPRLPQGQSEIFLPGQEIQCPRTLFLHGSGVMVPPASEHGASATDNVAETTREFFEDIELVGPGKTRRGKVLLLGNGYAGKTRLALNLCPTCTNGEEDSTGSDYRGSTHGIQFWNWPNYIARDSEDGPLSVQLHLWDFGGQEIYHNTHRAFMQSGSVFVVLWNPDQDGQECPQDGEYADTWYPLRYWLDFIHMESPYRFPEIAIVCSHQGDQWEARREELQQKLRDEIGNEYAGRIDLYILDSQSGDGVGQRTEVLNWLAKAVGRTVEAHGTEVPSYWGIAQSMVEEWLPVAGTPQQDTSGTTADENRIRTLPRADFAGHLDGAIRQTLETGTTAPTGDYHLLQKTFREGGFLTERRIERTLNFLTNTGWLYWKRDLAKQSVIVDQPWALDLVYAALERRKGTRVYDHLIESRGEFRLSDLQTWSPAWEKTDADRQQLVLSMMQSLGMAILRRSAWWNADENTYISLAHLPPKVDAIEAVRERYGTDPDDEEPCNLLHRGHWFAVVRDLIGEFGEAVTCSADACLVHPESYYRRYAASDRYLVWREMTDEKKQLGGRILWKRIPAEEAGDGDSGPAFDVGALIRRNLPGNERQASATVSEKPTEASCPAPPHPEKSFTIFLSYATDDPHQPTGREEPVDAVESLLDEWPQEDPIKVLRDRNELRSKGTISKFVEGPGETDVDLVIVFFSDKYWRSWWCMLELCYLLESFQHSGRGYDRSVLVVEQESGRAWTAGDLVKLKQRWAVDDLKLVDDPDDGEIPDGMPAQFTSFNWKKLLRRYRSVIEDRAMNLASDVPRIRRSWNTEVPAETLDWVREQIRERIQRRTDVAPNA